MLFQQINKCKLITIHNAMEHIKNIERRVGVDIGYHSSNIYPEDEECRVGRHGIDKSYTFEMVLELASKMEDKPNIIIRGGKNAKWYLKRVQKEQIDDEIEKTTWRNNIKYNTMYIIDWE